MVRQRVPDVVQDARGGSVNRPAFLTAPAVWTRAARQTPDPVRYAAAIECQAQRSPWLWHDLAIAGVGVGFVSLIYLGVI